MNLKPLMIGTLPTLRDHMLSMENLSPQKRYFALNDRVMKMRNGRPVCIELQGKDEIRVEQNNVITECAATSLQVHFGVTQDSAPSYYNASVVASAFVAAVGANSPYFYGKELWDESRVSVFEQSINLKSFRKMNGQYATRVSLGSNYVHDSIMELFLENLDGHPILLPDHSDSDPEWLEHLRLQNGTVWRWNRPLIGLSKDGKPALRLEFRVPSAGPTMHDALANMVFQIAIVEYLAGVNDLEDKIPFSVAESNFYSACKFGFDADITWVDGKTHNIQSLILNNLLPKAQEAMCRLGVDEGEVEKYLSEVIRPRVQTGQNGAGWQKAFVHTHGVCFQEMLEVYYDYQAQNIPVHKWKV